MAYLISCHNVPDRVAPTLADAKTTLRKAMGLAPSAPLFLSEHFQGTYGYDGGHVLAGRAYCVYSSRKARKADEGDGSRAYHLVDLRTATPIDTTDDGEV